MVFISQETNKTRMQWKKEEIKCEMSDLLALLYHRRLWLNGYSPGKKNSTQQAGRKNTQLPVDQGKKTQLNTNSLPNQIINGPSLRGCDNLNAYLLIPC